MRSQTTRSLGGRVNSDGTPASPGFTSRKLGPGNCVVTLPPGFRVMGAAANVGSGSAAIATYGYTENSFTTLTAGAVDVTFNFTATGVGV